MTVAAIDGNKRLYEIMVLYDAAEAAKEWSALVKELSERITKLEGQILKIDQWAENKKLAYEVKGLRRGTYLCGYFHLDPKQMAQLERSLRFDERVVRHLILVHEMVPSVLKEEKEKEEKEKGRGNREVLKEF